MAKNHVVINTSKICATNVDALNLAGIAQADADNGTLFVLGARNADGTYAVAPATAATRGTVYIAASPEIGSTVEMQVMNDPRYFYNEAGQAIALKQVIPDADLIEVAGLNIPDGFATIGANGVLVTATSAPTAAGQPYYTKEGTSTMTIGFEEVPSVLLRAHEV